MARKGGMRAKGAVANLIREAFERAGRAEPWLLKRALDEACWLRHYDDNAHAAQTAIRSAGLRIKDGDGPIEILPSGRDPALDKTVGVLVEEGRRLQSRIDAIKSECRALNRKAIEARLASEGREVPGEIEFGGHDCDGSPTGFCCFDPVDDPALDLCLFCAMPDERK